MVWQHKLLSFGSSEESVMRLESSGIAGELIDSLEIKNQDKQYK